jgi:Fe-S cluster assembly ATP-binding protein
MGILEIKDLRLTLGDKPILNGLTADFWEGHVHAIVGPNGAGKSTLASTLMGLSGYREVKGSIIFNGQDIVPLTIDQRARLGISLGWQEPARYEGLPVKAFIRAGRKSMSEAEVAETLRLVDLEPQEYMNRAIDKTLSGGERKRIEMASLLAMKPRLVILDEPDSGIDVDALNRIFDAIDILKKNGSTIILITHSPTVLRHAEHAFLLCSGAIIDKGPVDKVVDYFRNRCMPCQHKNTPAEEEEATEK